MWVAALVEEGKGIAMADERRRRLSFHYKGFLENGETFVDSTKGEPLSIVEGYRSVMPELEAALLGMDPGEEKVVHVGMGYGPYDPEALQTRIMRYAIPDGDKLYEGQEVMWTSPSNPQKPVPAKIVRADDYSFDIDFNHPLAGKDLTYWVKLVSVE